ncbi:hypothetical protein PUN28_009757 [Cardiocondyla obscurior]|uniref:Uncharacterized protein n=1 Tax=Cardiocondyla obscurior TaxID=286306 RepID=A0AAW2FME3_9HYME
MEVIQQQQPQQQQQLQSQQQQQQQSEQQNLDKAAGSDQPPLRDARKGHGRGRNRASWYNRQNRGRGERGGREGRGGRCGFHVDYYLSIFIFF